MLAAIGVVLVVAGLALMRGGGLMVAIAGAMLVVYAVLT